jgi:hypothetical protein
METAKSQKNFTTKCTKNAKVLEQLKKENFITGNVLDLDNLSVMSSTLRPRLTRIPKSHFLSFKKFSNLEGYDV